MTLKDIRDRLNSLRDSADIDAIDAADSLLGTIACFGFQTPEEFTKWMAETLELERQYAKHLQGREHKKPPDQNPLDTLGLKHTTIDALRRSGVTTVGQLEKLTLRQVWAMDGIGQIKINDINNCLKRAGKQLREENT